MSAVPIEYNRVFTIWTRISAAFSVMCSSYIAYSVISNHQKRSSPTQRTVLGMSCCDIIFSFFWFLGTWPMPLGTENVLGAIGNTQSCSMQGFFIQFSGVMTPMYNGFLALYVFLYVCKDQGGRLKNLEIFGHCFIVTVGLSTAIVGLALNLYNPGNIFCWIWAKPLNCTESFQSIDGTTDCVRGDNASIYQFTLAGAVAWSNLLWAFFSMTLVYLHVRKQERKMEAYVAEYSDRSTRRRRTHSDSRDVALRGALFTGAFLIAFLPATIDRSMYMAGQPVVVAEVFVAILFPSQGIFNLLVYIIHPAVSKHLKEKELRKSDSQDTTARVQDERSTNRDDDGHDPHPRPFVAETLGTGMDENSKSKQTNDE